jgi:dolichyl-phosphate-mannose--protein O-mannosyl transferase
MSDLEPPKTKYRWPWLVLAGVILGLILAVGWVSLAARKIAVQREGSTPLPNSAPAR